MSFLSDIGNAVSSAVNTVSNIASTVAPILFPGPVLALTAGNLIAQAVGGGVKEAANLLCKEQGMPKFLKDLLGGLIDKLITCQKPPHPECDSHVREHCGNDFRDFASEIGRSIADLVKDIRKGGCDEGGSDSWLVAIAKAMGKVAGQHAKRIAELSQKLETLNGKDPSQADQAMKVNNELQGETQMLNLLQTAFSNALKTIGEATATMARK
jgi:phage-related protein